MRGYSLLISFCFLLLQACTSPQQKLRDAIAAGEQRLINDSTRLPDLAMAEKVSHLYVQYANEYKDDTLSAEYLFRAGDLANGMRHFDDAVTYYRRLRTEYPQHRKVAAALFMEAFNLQTGLNRNEEARTCYLEFLAKYPSHPMAEAARLSVDQINSGLSDEELVRMFEAKNDSLAAGK
ncbi:MAG: tetratricopeptide repeat protein [Bacteroidota bacterium]|jgi:tetratricopeptide (TPR) repeat protein|uniref:tetratricopeptide repeat protein n=1 Tax=Candidatus Pollutiaquabacter sp. TaxID=3416354 RepID=UPI001A38EF65|nr:tetratricopeptide repeat protein [Bacteroidota bacterium]MBL7948232.1 tetratricopeptide repeat protein [Bacteroidia bacterium]HRU60748.1 tetratricopeptide repeat protein [Bacteroidia bacterium]